MSAALPTDPRFGRALFAASCKIPASSAREFDLAYQLFNGLKIQQEDEIANFPCYPTKIFPVRSEKIPCFHEQGIWP
jgi:hypothetical protein